MFVEVRGKMRPSAAVFVLESLYSQRFLLVHVGEHEADVGGQQVVHLVAQRGLAQQLGPTHQVAWTIHRTE